MTSSDTAVENARRRIEEQKRLIETLQAEGKDATAAMRLLSTYEDVLHALLEG
jgi:hypothetical protein